MSILGDIAKVATGVLTASNPVAGLALGVLKDKGPQILGEFLKNPVGTLTNPMSLPSQLADGVLGKLGIKADYRSLSQFSLNPLEAISSALKNPAALSIGGVAANIGAMLNPTLKTNGTDVVDTGRYLISMKEDGVKVFDKTTNTWVNAYGEGHLGTKDGDKGSFGDKPLTLQLQDGTKITIDSKKLPNGASNIENVVISKGNEAVAVAGFNDNKVGLQMTNRTGLAATIMDMKQPDGTVLKVGHQVDDLYGANGKQFRGSDPTKPFGEIDLDGFGKKFEAITIKPGGGKDPITVKPGNVDTANWPQEVKDLIAKLKEMLAGNKPTAAAPTTGGSSSTGGTASTGGSSSTSSPAASSSAGGSSSSGGVTGSSVMSRIMEILAKLQDKLEAKAEELAGVEDEGKLRQGMFELQQLQNMIQQITSMATNIQKTHHDSAMGIIRNFN